MKLGRPTTFASRADEVIRVRVPRELGAALRRIAHENETNRTTFIRDAIDDAVEAAGHKRLFSRG